MSDTQIPLTENGLHQVNGVWWLVQPRGVVQNAVGLPNNRHPFNKSTFKKSNWMPQHDFKNGEALDFEGLALEQQIHKSCLKYFLPCLPDEPNNIRYVVGDYSKAIASIHLTHNQGMLNLIHIEALTPATLGRLVDNISLSNMTVLTILGLRTSHRNKLEALIRQIGWKRRRIFLQFEEEFYHTFDAKKIEVKVSHTGIMNKVGNFHSENVMKAIGTRHLKNLMRSHNAML